MNYTTLQSRLATFMVVPTSDANFVIVLPEIIALAENRIYRDCDFLNQRAATTVACTPNARTVTLPNVTTTAGTTPYKVVQNINAVTPTATAPDAGTRVGLQRVSRDFLDFVWPTAATATGVPQYFALLDDQTVRLAPTPDQAYNLEVVGTFRPVQMGINAGAPANTYVGDNYEDLFFAACMVAAAGYQKNFGAAADDPRMGMSWEAAYQGLVKSAVSEAFRQKGEGEAWTPYQPSPLAQPARS